MELLLEPLLVGSTTGYYRVVLAKLQFDWRIFLWKVVSVLIIAGLMGSADNPDRNTGLMKNDHASYCTWAESLFEIFPRNSGLYKP